MKKFLQEQLNNRIEEEIMGLSQKNYRELEAIQKNLVNHTVTNSEIQEFLKLMEKSGNEEAMLSCTKILGFDSTDKLRNHSYNEGENQDLIKGLAVIGGAILLAWSLIRK